MPKVLQKYQKLIKIVQIYFLVLQKTATDGEDGSESESDWGSDSDSESTSSDDEGQYQNIRERFIKKYVLLIYDKIW